MNTAEARLRTAPPQVEPSPEGPTERRNRAFESEALPHMDAVYGFALRLAHDESRAQDLVQDTFLHAFRAWHQYTPGTNCRSWLFTICRNLQIRSEDRRKRHLRILEETATDRSEHPGHPVGPLTPEPTPTPERLFFHPRIDARILEAIDALPPEYRETVVLADIEGLTYQEVAQVTEVPVGTVRSRLFRGRRILRRSIRDYAVQNGFLESN